MTEGQWALLGSPFVMNATTLTTVFGNGCKVALPSSILSVSPEGFDVLIIANMMLSPGSESSSSGNGSDIATNSSVLWETNQEEALS